jgi:PAS domain S-box-containing protein
MQVFPPGRLSFRSGIARKFIVGILLFSSVITLAATGLQLYLDYSHDINSIEKSLDQIEASHLEGIIHSIWVSNQHQLQIQLEGILELPNMQYIEIRESSGQSFSYGSLDTTNTISRDYALYYTYRGERLSLGAMQVVASLDGIYSRLWNKTLVILASQTVKTFLVSGFIFILFYMLIGRHLLTLVGYAKSFDPNASPEAFAFDRKKSDPPDELDQVVASMNQMRSRLRKYLLELKESDEAQRESEEKWRTIVSESPVGIIVYDDTGQSMEANESATVMIGAKREQVLKQNYHSIESWKKSGMYDVALEAVREKITRDFQLVTETSFGKIVHLDCYLVPYAAGGLMLMIMDISERLKTEKELLKNQSFLEKAQEIGSIGTWELDTKKSELLWTDENYRIFGLPIGTKLTYEIFLDCVHPEDREYVDREWKAAFDKKPYDIEHRLLVDGKVKWVREKAELEFNDKDECIRGVGVTQDITGRKLAEQALRESEERYRDIYDNAPDMFVSVDTATAKIRQCNLTLLKELGYSKEEVVGQPIYMVYHPDSLEEAKKVFATFTTTGKVKDAELQLRRKDGTRIDVSLNVSAVRDADGNIVESRSIWRDISEPKRMECELRESEEKLRLTIENSPIGVCTVDLNGIFVETNPAYEKITGYSKEELRELSIYDLTHPDDRPKNRNLFQDMTSNKSAGFKFEKRYIRKNGSEISVLVHAQAVHDAAGKTMFGLAMIDDITERKQTENALLKSENQYRLLADNTLDVIWTMNMELEFTYVNPVVSNVFGHTPEEWIGSKLQEHCDEKYFFQMAQVITKEIARGPASSGVIFETVMLKKNREPIPFEIHGKAIFNENGDPVALQGVTRDITERVHAQDKIKNSLAEKETLLREIHHRVKNNLQVISSMLSLQSRKIKGTPEADLLQESRSRIQTMAQIHESLYRSTDLRHVNLEDYITSISKNLFRMNKADASRVSLDIDIASVLLEIEQAIPCGMIINELLSNSLSHAFAKKKKGKIKIRLLEEKDRFTLSYEDNGIGFPEGFTPESSDTLGMKLVKTFVLQLRGDLEYESNDGVQFKIVFPRLKEKIG